MHDFFTRIFGYGKDLDTLQVSVRAFVMFFIALFLLRIGGIRIFGKKSAFDEIVAIMLGAILSRGIMGASPFGTTVAAGAMIIAVHRLVAWCCIKSPRMERMLKGKEVILYKKGTIFFDKLRQCSLSESDLRESLRLETGQTTLNDIDMAYMETSGRISFILKKEAKSGI